MNSICQGSLTGFVKLSNPTFTNQNKDNLNVRAAAHQSYFQKITSNSLFISGRQLVRLSDNWLIFLCLQDSHCQQTLITLGTGDSWYLAKQTDFANNAW